MDVDERVDLIRVGAVLGYLWEVGQEQEDIGTLAVLQDILDKLRYAAEDAGALEECLAALCDVAGFLRRLGAEDQARVAPYLRMGIIQIATRAQGRDVLAHLRELPDDLAEALETDWEFE